MIEVNLYREFLSELATRTARSLNEENQLLQHPVCFSNVVAAMNEGHLITLLKDLDGILLCGNVPGAHLQRGSYVESQAECIIYILEKSPKDRQGTPWEFDRYALMQHLMSHLCSILMGKDAFHMLCESGAMTVDELNVEPEYNVYGGFNGWSVTFTLPDGKGTALA